MAQRPSLSSSRLLIDTSVAKSTSDQIDRIENHPVLQSRVDIETRENVDRRQAQQQPDDVVLIRPLWMMTMLLLMMIILENYHTWIAIFDSARLLDQQIALKFHFYVPPLFLFASKHR